MEGLLSLHPVFLAMPCYTPTQVRYSLSDNNPRLQLLDPELGHSSCVGVCLAWGHVNVIVQHNIVYWLLHKLSNEPFDSTKWKNTLKAEVYFWFLS